MLSRYIIPALLVTALMVSCKPVQKLAGPPKPQKIEFNHADQDSTEYELTIIDPGFETWLAANRKPIWYYTKDYLATWNYQYVVAWNQRVRDPMSQRNADNPFIMEIDYRPGIDYGLELNYKLYQYFRYVEETWGRILPYDRRN